MSEWSDITEAIYMVVRTVWTWVVMDVSGKDSSCQAVSRQVYVYLDVNQETPSKYLVKNHDLDLFVDVSVE